MFGSASSLRMQLVPVYMELLRSLADLHTPVSTYKTGCQIFGPLTCHHITSPAYCSPLQYEVKYMKCILLDNVVFTRGAAAHLPDKPLIAFYDTHGQKGGDGILLCRHHTAVALTCNNCQRSTSDTRGLTCFVRHGTEEETVCVIVTHKYT